jgi:hypothetical protein
MQQVEFRLYYDNSGNVLFYTCDKPEGQYIVIDSSVYAECKMNLKIVDGKIVRKYEAIFTQLVHAIDGVVCANQDVSIVVTDDYPYTNSWDIETRKVTGA